LVVSVQGAALVQIAKLVLQALGGGNCEHLIGG